jgi:hypothetical protein
MLPFMLFLAVVLVALAVVGTTISGMFYLTVTAAMLLGLTLVIGGWTVSRRRDHV